MNQHVCDVISESFSHFRLQQLKEIKTGTCLCLCQGEARSLTANIGAALKLQMPFVETKLQVLTADPMLYYIEGIASIYYNFTFDLNSI